MARTRVFVSSTYYDLRHIRSSLQNFIELLGHEAILSEKGDIAYSPDIPLDESCYREVGNADLYVLLIGGRYGSERSQTRALNNAEKKSFFDRYDSITKQEYKQAVQASIPIYILIERAVYAEYRTFLRNKELKDISYAHVDSVNVFFLIDDILSQPKNNPVHEFEKYADIEEWLKEQWSGLFKELLRRRSSQQQLATLSTQVSALTEVNATLKRYLEKVVTDVSKTPQESEQIIKEEEERLRRTQALEQFRQNRFVRYLVENRSGETHQILKAMFQATDLAGFCEALNLEPVQRDNVYSLLTTNTGAFQDFNEARRTLDLPEIRTNGSDVSRSSRTREHDHDGAASPAEN